MVYETKLEGHCGYMVKVKSWKNGLTIECSRREDKRTEWRKPGILYNEVMAYCAHCPLRRGETTET